MPVSLQKGQKVDLTKGNPGLKKIMVGLGWDVNQYDSGADFDLDASAFLLGDNGKRFRFLRQSCSQQRIRYPSGRQPDR